MYRYFGRVNQEFGRPLWEIVMNLKNFGKGRLVTRSTFVKECPSIPSFYKIVSVHPHILEYPVGLMIVLNMYDMTGDWRWPLVVCNFED